ncbi:3-phosphoshikimate 1-carboxyvinyltransferase [bacterium]|nr:3-phosphoshikimate 1-carboxyvinyltransferase [bacterium]
MDITVKKSNRLKGEVVIPADKSISHRAIMFSSLAKGKSIVKNLSQGADCFSTLGIFKQLGIKTEFKDEKTLLIDSTDGIIAPSEALDCGNSGTSMRLISGILAGQNFNSIMVGDESLSKRPMRRVVEPLTQMGANIESKDGHAPLKIVGKDLKGIRYLSKLASAQVKSCILLAGLNASGETTVIEPYLSRNHTELMLEYMGADIKTGIDEDGDPFASIKKSELEPKNIYVTGDISSAAYFIVAGLIIPNSEVILHDVGLNETRTGIIKVVQQMGGDIEILDKKTVSGEVMGDIRVKSSELKSINIEGEIIPRLIDELPVIAVLATQAEGQTVVRNAQDLRNKESDRIKTIVTELKKVGADIEETPDGFIINGKTNLKGDAEIETYHDHRLAMSMYVAGMVCEKEILIKDFEWVNISFPEFESLMNSLG